MENTSRLLIIIGNFVNVDGAPDGVLDRLYPLVDEPGGEGLRKWWDEMFRRARKRNAEA